MTEIRYTDFMKSLKKLVPPELPKNLQNYHFGETTWLFQMYYGHEKRIHYEVSRVTAFRGKMLEIGLHFESKDKELNYRYLQLFQDHLIQVRDALGEQVVAEVWDKGWTKVYEAYPNEVFTAETQAFVAQRLATFISVIQPLYEQLTRVR
jgi:hypothetical protein